MGGNTEIHRWSAANPPHHLSGNSDVVTPSPMKMKDMRQSRVVGAIWTSRMKRPIRTKTRNRPGIKTETIPEASNEIDVDEMDRMQRFAAVLLGDEPTPVARRILDAACQTKAWRATKQRLRSSCSASKSSDS